MDILDELGVPPGNPDRRYPAEIPPESAAYNELWVVGGIIEGSFYFWDFGLAGRLSRVGV